MRVLLALFLVLVGLSARAAVAVVSVIKDDDAAEAKTTFAPEVEEKFTKFLTKLKEAKRKVAGELMQKKVEEVVKVTGLAPEGARALEQPARQAAELGVEADLTKLDVLFRKQWGRRGEQINEVLDQLLAQVELYARSSVFGVEQEPTEQPVWTEALQRALSPAQLAAWQKAVAEAKASLSKEFADLVKTSVERLRDQQQAAMATTAGQIKRSLALSEERAQKLDELAKAAVAQAAEAWRVRGEKMLLAMPEPQRKIMLKQGSLYLSPEEQETPEKQPAWKDGLAKLFSPADLKLLKSARDEKKSRRAVVMGKMMVALLDERVAFTASQREQLQPIAERLVKSEAAFFPQEAAEGFIDLETQMFLTAGAKAKPEELGKILDPTQQKHWKEPAAPQASPTRAFLRARKAPPAAKVEPPAREPEPEFIEQAISDFLTDKAQAERKRTAATMVLKAEDVARVTGLPEAPARRLQTAARGAAETTLENWKVMMEEQVRSNVSEATPQNVKQRLESMEDYFFARNREAAAEKFPVWEAALKAELTDAQRAAWKKEVDARTAYRESAIASLILAEFDRRHSLAAEQWGKLEPLIVQFMKEYTADIESMFSSSNSSPWYMESYSMFLPFAGIPEKELKGVLEKEQWDHWAGSNEFGNVSNYWDNIRENHERRKKVRVQ